MNDLKHIALIMDGNGRWSEQRHKGRSRGHIAGARKAFEIIDYVSRTEISTLSLFAFSTENWLRPLSEVSVLMNIMAQAIHDHSQFFSDRQIRFRHIGDRQGLPTATLRAIDLASRSTALNKGLNLCVAVNYSGQQDICQAIKNLANRGEDLTQLTREKFELALSTAPLSEPDLIIRTGGESRLSNFFLWQAAYSEIHFEKKLWPDFQTADLQKHIDEFHNVERRFGKIQR